MVRRLVVTNIGGIGGSEKVLLVGISIRPGRGQYRHTNICTISPRFQIHNNTSFHLQFSQKCFATIVVSIKLRFCIKREIFYINIYNICLG